MHNILVNKLIKFLIILAFILGIIIQLSGANSSGGGFPAGCIFVSIFIYLIDNFYLTLNKNQYFICNSSKKKITKEFICTVSLNKQLNLDNNNLGINSNYTSFFLYKLNNFIKLHFSTNTSITIAVFSTYDSTFNTVVATSVISITFVSNSSFDITHDADDNVCVATYNASYANNFISDINIDSSFASTIISFGSKYPFSITAFTFISKYPSSVTTSTKIFINQVIAYLLILNIIGFFIYFLCGVLPLLFGYNFMNYQFFSIFDILYAEKFGIILAEIGVALVVLSSFIIIYFNLD